MKNACGSCGAVPAESCSTPIDDNCNGQINEGCCVASAEVCGDGKDNDCDGVIDNPVLWYRDCDSDGYGAAAGSVMACAQPTDATCTYSRTAAPGDCDDTNAERHPGAKPLVTAESPISPLYLDTYSGDTNCDGVFQRVSMDFLSDSLGQSSGVDFVSCTPSNACRGGKACYSIGESSPDGTVAGCGNTFVTVSVGGGATGCLLDTGTLRVICQ